MGNNNKKCFYSIYILAIVLLFVVDINSQITKRYKIIDLGTFGAESYATGINNKGHVVGYSRASGSDIWRGFIWKDGSLTDIGSLGYDTWAFAVNDSDEVTGHSIVSLETEQHAFRWENGTMTDLGTLGGNVSYGYAINNSGAIVGESIISDNSIFSAYLWNGAMVNLGIDSVYRSAATGINNSGKITGWNDALPANVEGWLFDGGIINLGHLGGSITWPKDINDDAAIVGASRTSNNEMHAFLWQNGSMIDLNINSPFNSAVAYSINSSGEIVGSPAFVYKNGQMKKLNDLIDPSSGWVLQVATCINDSGWIVGGGMHNNQTRAFLLKPISFLITEPAANELWIAGEKDTIKWNGGKKNQFLQIDYSVDSGKTFNIIDFIPNGDTGMYVWDIPKEILSKKCMIRIVDMADTTIADTSDVFKIKGYILTRDSSGQYEPYRREEDQWGFWNNQPDMFPQVWYQQFFYQGIDPFTNSQYSQWQGWFTFAFAKSSDFLDWASWVNTFGVNACYVSTILGMYSPTAIQRWSAVKHPWGGSCFGISASNALAFSYKGQFQTKYSSFPAFVNPITVLSNEGVKTVVNELFTHQFGDPSRKFGNGRWNVITPNQTIIELKEMLRKDEVSPRTLSIYNNNGPGGHSILPYRLERDVTVEYLFRLYVYDNAYPNNLAIIKIDTLGNSNNGIWTTLYGLANWGGEKNLILEIESIDYFNNATFPKRAAGYNSPFVMSSDELEIYTNIDANTKIIDALGNVTGFSNGSVLSEIPNSVPLSYLDGSETPPYGYSLPTNDYSVIFDNFTSDTVKTFFFTGNKTFSYSRDSAEQNQTDRFFFDGGVSVSNPDQQNKTISLLNIINETTQEKLFAFSSIELAQNDSVKIENPDSNKIKLKSFGTAKDYDIELNYVTESGIGRFVDSNIPLTSNTTHTIIPDWTDVTETQLKILVDEGNDGTIDDTLSLINKLTGIGNDQGSVIPKEFRLEQNYPNPFNPSTTIRYQIPINSHVSLKVYDVLGNEVATLVDEYREAGRYEVEFNAKGLASGVYFYKLQAGIFVETKKMLLVK